MSDDLNKLLESVDDEKSFLRFVNALRKDKETGGWENNTINSFLEAACAWAEDSEFGANQNLGEAAPWKKFAVFLYCGKIYE